jgi:hypothetical protein
MGVIVEKKVMKLEQLIKDLSYEQIHLALARAGFKVESIAKTVHKYQNRTGYLTNSARTYTNVPYEVTVAYSAEYAGYVEEWSPFLEPAAETGARSLRAVLSHMIRRAQ